MAPLSNVAVVVPTCRGYTIPDQSIPVQWYIVHDRQRWDVVGEAAHIVAPDSLLYGKRCDSIRAAGFLEAYRDGAQFILTVDDDCRLPIDWAERHVDALISTVHPWSYTVEHLHTRGMPYLAKSLPVAVTHGLWDGVPDVDGEHQLSKPDILVRHVDRWQRIHPPFAQSIMNLGFRRDVITALYQPAQGEDTPFDRFADIWAGVIGQRALTLHDYAYLNGGACVYHARASNAEVNKRKEAPGKKAHESFWKWVWTFNDKGSDLKHTYAKLAWYVKDYARGTKIEESPYFAQLGDNMLRWIEEVDAV